MTSFRAAMFARNQRRDLSDDRIVTAFVERVAAAQPLHTQPHALNGSVFFDRLEHVLGACRIISASGRQERRDHQFVALEGHGYDCLHLANNRPTSRRKSSNGASSTLRRGLKTIFQLSGSRSNWDRTASRIRRFSRLRVTAFPNARGTVKPKRAGVGGPDARRQKAAK